MGNPPSKILPTPLKGAGRYGMACRLCQNYVFASTSIFLENLLSASTFEIRVDIYERRLAFSRRRLKFASTFMNVDLLFHVDV